jgi:hypothetical protein
VKGSFESATKMLAARGSSALGAAPDAATALGTWGPLGDELRALLALRDGFYAFDDALLVRPTSRPAAPCGIVEWNAPELWKREYDFVDLGKLLFFAEDAFGGQFGLGEGAVRRFEPETGDLEIVARTLEDWARRVLSDASFETGFPLAREWAARHAPLARGQRLVPKKPFVLGGDYAVENLYVLDDVKAMRFRASIARQIRGLPDGTKVSLEVSPDE